jgi:SpoVK/Ycf46/Vps4 family AAA+-type ATPase
VKKKNIINLIKYYSEENDAGFKNEAYEIAKEFDTAGDFQLAEYIMALMSNANTFVPQINEYQSCYFEKVNVGNEPLPLPEPVKQDILGIVNAVERYLGVNKFLFQGAPGTGKTETVKQVARILNRELYMVVFASIVDSKLGQTQKNIVSLFKEINGFAQPEKVLILFDEIDSLALDRTNPNDLREMGRATSTLLKEMERIDERIVIIATTNLFKHFDKALIRRFDSVIDFNRYSKEDLLEIAEVILNIFLSKFKPAGKNIRLFRKIVSFANPIPFPGELKNIIRTAIAFSNPSYEFDYLKRLYYSVNGEKDAEIRKLQEQGFTVREIEILTGISKSQVSRGLKGEFNE